LNPGSSVNAGRRNLGAAKASVCEVSKWLSTNVKVEELIDARLIRKLDESGYMDKVAANYGLK
jgi:hypothetical protein